MKRLGILGGMGPHATQHFMQVLLDTIARRRRPTHDQDYPDMTVFYENSTPDRTLAIKSDATEAAARINQHLAHLLSLGCHPVAVACITAHSLIEPEMFARGVLDFRDCLIRLYTELRDTAIAVLATDGSLATGVFVPLEKHFKLLYPNDTPQRSIMEAIYGPKGLKADPAGSTVCRQALDRAIAAFEAQGAGAFLTGCTELEMFMAREYAHLRLLLPMVSLCEHMCDLLAEDN
ncbi:MAG TPA: aspartate/glutamate racemase family protein [Acidobacteriota bacterium]|nr:aspartate/glutamate racemase family protein [Acidobacteriota bacterium]